MLQEGAELDRDVRRLGGFVNLVVAQKRQWDGLSFDNIAMDRYRSHLKEHNGILSAP